MARSLNKVTLIGNLTRDPELRYTPQGNAVCSFGLATNRQWTTEGGEKKEDAEFHRIVAWNKLAEICSQLLKKGRKVYLEGRLQTRNWTAQDGTNRSTTEVVISDMILLDSRREGSYEESFDVPESALGTSVEPQVSQTVKETPKEEASDATSGVAPKDKAKPKKKEARGEKKEPSVDQEEKVEDEDIPF